jgi:dihydrofolate reductase
MGKIIVSQNVSLDGVVEDPTGEEGLRYGDWFGQVSAVDREAWVKVEMDEAFGAEALLLGRQSDEWFAQRWLTRTGEWADRLNSLAKYVVSSTLAEPRWGRGTVLKGDVATEVAQLKWGLAGEIVVYSSRRLVQTLLEHDLVDELRLTVYPFVLGTGGRLFGELSGTTNLRLLDSRTLGDGLAWLQYEVVRAG